MIISFILYYVTYIYNIKILLLWTVGKVGKINVTNNYPKPEIIVTTLPSNNIEQHNIHSQVW